MKAHFPSLRPEKMVNDPSSMFGQTQTKGIIIVIGCSCKSLTLVQVHPGSLCWSAQLSISDTVKSHFSFVSPYVRMLNLVEPPISIGPPPPSLTSSGATYSFEHHGAAGAAGGRGRRVRWWSDLVVAEGDGIIIDDCYGSFPHSLRSTSKLVNTTGSNNYI